MHPWASESKILVEERREGWGLEKHDVEDLRYNLSMVVRRVKELLCYCYTVNSNESVARVLEIADCEDSSTTVSESKRPRLQVKGHDAKPYSPPSPLAPPTPKAVPTPPPPPRTAPQHRSISEIHSTGSAQESSDREFRWNARCGWSPQCWNDKENGLCPGKCAWCRILAWLG